MNLDFGDLRKSEGAFDVTGSCPYAAIAGLLAIGVLDKREAEDLRRRAQKAGLQLHDAMEELAYEIRAPGIPLQETKRMAAEHHALQLKRVSRETLELFRKANAELKP